MKEYFPGMGVAQQGTLGAFQSEIYRLGVTESTIQVLQDKADKQSEQLIRLEAMITQLISK